MFGCFVAFWLFLENGYGTVVQASLVSCMYMSFKNFFVDICSCLKYNDLCIYSKEAMSLKSGSIDSSRRLRSMGSSLTSTPGPMVLAPRVRGNT